MTNHNRGDVKRRKHYKHRYGIALEFVNALYAQQQGRCAICDQEIGFLQGRRAAVDHDHGTGLVRGLLCRSCNSHLDWALRYETKIKEYALARLDKENGVV